MDIDIKKIFKEMRKGAREISRSYIAAFVDGEGCITINIVGGGSIVLRVNFSQTDPKILKKIQEKYGGKIYSKRRNPKWKKIHELAIYKTDEVTKILHDIYPYIIGKRKQIGVAFIFIWLKSQFRKGKGYQISKDIKELLITCKKLMHMLNKKGNIETTELEENIERSIRGLLFQVGDLTVKESIQLKLF